MIMSWLCKVNSMKNFMLATGRLPLNVSAYCIHQCTETRCSASVVTENTKFNLAFDTWQSRMKDSRRQEDNFNHKPPMLVSVSVACRLNSRHIQNVYVQNCNQKWLSDMYKSTKASTRDFAAGPRWRLPPDPHQPPLTTSGSACVTVCIMLIDCFCLRPSCRSSFKTYSIFLFLQCNSFTMMKTKTVTDISLFVAVDLIVVAREWRRSATVTMWCAVCACCSVCVFMCLCLCAALLCY